MRRARPAVTALAALLAVPLLTSSASAQVDPPKPVFADGQAQPVFDPKDVVRQSLWVSAPVDSDFDGKDDLVHVEVVRPKATELGMKVPVIYQASPYYAGGNDVPNHGVDQELYVPGKPGNGGHKTASRGLSDERVTAAMGPNAPITWRYESYFTARGFAVVYAESLGSGLSTGCPTSGGRNETIGAKSVVDWLNGRAPGADAAGAPVAADWTTGKVGMMGVSYNGTLPNAVATTGVEGLETIVPIAAISSWYDYYRADGLVVAPGTFQGEDLDVLADYVYTREDREICKPVIAEILTEQDRVTGDYSPFWDERNYLNDVGNVRASVFAVHGLNDWNVKMTHVEQWYTALKRHGVEHKIWLHQSGHADPFRLRQAEWMVALNRWMSHYLYAIDNGVEDEPKSTVQREDMTWHDEADWPAPGTMSARLYPSVGGSAHGGLSARPSFGRPVVESLTDDVAKTAEELAAAAASDNRLSYVTRPAAQPLRISGVVRADLRLSFSKPAANVTVLLVDRAPDGKTSIVTRGWTDPQNRQSPSQTKPIQPGKAYDIQVDLVPDDYVLAAGHSLAVVVMSSDYDYTLRPRPGAGISLDLSHSYLTLPAVGGQAAVRASVG
ncbi:X-Pro dipeptidyl-peptidase [Actinokineospora alba]|uniref:Xaa-Pro dipeptidyl-peptidase n=1 Tax=Actinokineospora alba TaxID=504798 RepID=A0A1H0JES7_9PSEU|nr:Xaa-Pro dipeptidyl-peptidase [Actinokineospora alba]TDP68314.1 X-Pro dipeptidyl-peptidase [Actinokineospora alba]SDH96684.1 X-Pro dipeptidyl-peptidase [Actinokineospora alba]SDO42305.1 X-Pro dipeptidyl-peptidase [Actinokineospora alba]